MRASRQHYNGKTLALSAERALPEGWALVPIEECFDSWGGATPSTADPSFWGGSIPWISSKDVKSPRIKDGVDFVTKKALGDGRLRMCPPGSVLVVVRSGVLVHTLPVAITDTEVVINQDLKAFFSPCQSLNEWLALALRAMAPEILGENRKDGTTVQSVRFDQLKKLQLPIPPLAEQKRIVAKVEALLARVNAARERLARIPAILTRFRQSILAAACSGRLTEGWRRVNVSVEPAENQLERLLAERKLRWSKRNPGRRYKEPERLRDNDLPEIPDSWVWTNFDNCSWEITVGHVGPMRDRYVSKGVAFLRCQNVRHLRYDATGLVRIPPSFHRSLAKSKLTGGEILVVRSGANTGDCCVLPRGIGESNCADLVITRPLSGLLSEYGAIYVASPLGQSRLVLGETGIAQPHFNIGAMRVKAFPLPPVDEQREIIRRVESLFALADAIENRRTAGAPRVDKLTQAILAKAFRGDLVPAEVDLARAEGRPYEPASALLDRLHSAERAEPIISRRTNDGIRLSRMRRAG